MKNPLLAFPASKAASRLFNLPNPIPRRYRRRLRSKFRSRQSPSSNITDLQTSWSPLVTLRTLQQHKWNIYDAQYAFMFTLWVISLCLVKSKGPLLMGGFLLLTAFSMPITRQVFLPALPIITWLVFYFSCRFIPSEYRPGIWVRVLPALENIVYGANLSNILSAHKHAVLDVLAWLPYGIIHFGAPAVVTGILFIFAAPGTAPLFARCFGYINIVGVMIQLSFPSSPPWYENLYGLAPANYSIPGSPAGLARIDMLFGFDMYTSNFTASPLVFGAFPSMHAGSAVIEALFMSYCFPKLKPFFIGYAMWLWWATMYLSHHYAVDLVGGSLISAIAFYYAKARFLPRRQRGKLFRWDYDYVEVGDGPSENDEYSFSELDHYKLRGTSWSSNSSFSSGSMSPNEDSHSSLWEGETLTSQTSDNEYSDASSRS